MGQKIHPTSYRLGVIETWKSKWFSPLRSYRHSLREDVLIRQFVSKRLAEARVEKIEIERPSKVDEIIVNIYTAKPGMVIGRGGSGIEELKAAIEKEVLKNQVKIKVNIHEIRQGSLSASVVAQNIASDLERRMPYRRAAKQGLGLIQKANAKGAKIRVAGRLNGADIARTEVLNWGSVPLHTLRANIDYAQIESHTTYGVIGVSVWIYKGEVLDEENKEGSKKQDDVLKQIKDIRSEKKE